MDENFGGGFNGTFEYDYRKVAKLFDKDMFSDGFIIFIRKALKLKSSFLI
jgi:hypothetical protein